MQLYMHKLHGVGVGGRTNMTNAWMMIMLMVSVAVDIHSMQRKMARVEDIDIH